MYRVTTALVLLILAASSPTASATPEHVSLQKIADARGDTWRCQDSRNVPRTRASRSVASLARSGTSYRAWVHRRWRSRASACVERRSEERAAARKLASCGRYGSHSNPNVRLGCVMSRAYGFQYDFDALYHLWNHESGWSTTANNPNSDACGIPQAMNNCSYGYDAGAQIAWGLRYIAGRYGSPSAAYAHLLGHNWY